jgi:regulatory protein
VGFGFGAVSLKGRALRALAQREHSRTELERKLLRHAEDTDEASAAQQVAAALDELTAHGLISEARVAESVLASQAPRMGARRLRQTLVAKGLPPELVSSTLQAARGTELERAQALWQRRFGAPPVDAAARVRQLRFLIGRGFDGETVRRVVPRAAAASTED